MERYNNTAFVIVDAERGFMPASEGVRLNAPGFGELPVPGGEKIVPKINAITKAAGKYGILIAATLDSHPNDTAHFSDTPNFTNTWPRHCVGDTPGSELHPDLDIAIDPQLATRFIKGDQPCASPEDDTSYTGALAHNPETGIYLPEFLRQNDRTDIIVAGLAIGDGGDQPLCVDSTAIDLHDQGFNVTLVIDAVEAVLPENRETCLRNLGAKGIRLATASQILAELEVQS